MNKTAQPGFSLIEILIAIAIMVILGTVVVPSMMSYLSGAKDKAAKMALKTLKTSIMQFNVDIGQYPETLTDLVKKPSNEALAQNWRVPYVEGKSALIDPWTHKYQYMLTPEGEHPFELYSYGPKGKPAPKTEWISVWDL